MSERLSECITTPDGLIGPSVSTFHKPLVRSCLLLTHNYTHHTPFCNAPDVRYFPPMYLGKLIAGLTEACVLLGYYVAR